MSSNPITTYPLRLVPKLIFFILRTLATYVSAWSVTLGLIDDSFISECAPYKGGSQAGRPKKPVEFQEMISELPFAVEAIEQSVPVAKELPDKVDFPPPPITQEHINKIIHRWCSDSEPSEFEEAGCTVCSQLTLKTKLSPIKHISAMLHILEADGVTRLPCLTPDDPILEVDGPVLDNTCNGMVCDPCRSSIRSGKVPKLGLCNGLWLGEVPPELKKLTYYEVRRGAGRVNGHYKLVSNVVAFENPTAKIYSTLPPPRSDIDEVLAIMFSGSSAPTDEDYQHSLLFIHRNIVAEALRWLILNHPDYSDVTFSSEHLDQYSEHQPIVAVEFFKSRTNRTAEGISVHDDLEDDGIEDVSEDIEHLSSARLKAKAIEHLDNSDQGSNISSRLLSVNKDTLQTLATCMASGEYVKPSNDSEKLCFDLLCDLDQASTQTKGSVYSKKVMQHEIWSLITHVGGPTWYFTLTPCNFKHPICIYYADTNENFDVPLRTKDQRHKLLSQNPVVGARFFDMMVRLFLKHVVGESPSEPGLFGPASAYYCTVEQQGRLTLHLHGLVFTSKKMSPLEIKQWLLDPESDFQKKLIAYVESIQVGEFLTGTKADVQRAVETAEESDSYLSPELTLPVPPPIECYCSQEECSDCSDYLAWLSDFCNTIDDLLFKSNLHNCYRGLNPDSTVCNQDKWEVSCLNNKYGKCKAHFPRNIILESMVDPESGHVFLKKLEPWLNDICPALTYLVRSNTDVMCLLSGTAIKAAVCYVTDYMTKTSLKTHMVFDSIRTIFDKNTEIVNGSKSDKEKTRSLLTKMVNLLSTKLELGSPMISLYLLQNPDHYTSHTFVRFYWKSFVAEARRFWHPDDARGDTSVVIIKKENCFVGIASVHDYIYHPRQHDSFNLYDWIRRFRREHMRKRKLQKQVSEPINVDPAVQSDSDGEDTDSVPIDSSAGLTFLKDHPLALTHHLVATRDWKQNVPNFIGGPLPRPDKDDREYYCSTMLTFFKLWRSGADLKQEDESWHEAFDSYKFDESALQYIKNINLRYECLDARDDYRAQLLKKATSAKPSLHLPFSDEGMMDAAFENDLACFDNPVDEVDDRIILYDPDTAMTQGNSWASPLVNCDAPQAKPNVSVPTPILRMPPAHWTTLLRNQRQDILMQRHQQKPNDTDKPKRNPNAKCGISYGSLKTLCEDVISNAAALLEGSMYHYLLGINSRQEEVTKATITEVCSRLDGVEYLVVDEVSMLTCTDMYKISETLARIRSKHEDPFGGMNMIFSGDFAQLPPAIGGESVSLYSHRIGKHGKTIAEQSAAIGKALWHQVKYVVILRKNMRNSGLSADDLKFRTALENMHYKACTKDDIAFLNTLVSSKKPGRHYVGAAPWRNAPIIVGENRQKDEINHLGCIRFAADTNQALLNFYSDDTISTPSQSSKLRTSKRNTHKSPINSIDKSFQELLWQLPPSSHEYHAPPVLSLCIGLPVIIRHNVATELSITKGQRGTVHSWHATKGNFDQLVLDVLFVQLTDPPKPVHIDGLPPNVVPLVRREVKGHLYLPDNTRVVVSRLQIDILPGFAMTTFASQGQSLEVNNTDPNTYDNHHAFYTALSRSKSAEKTVMLQGFEPRHITGSASGALRKEFRELELLDEITMLRYEGKLDASVNGSTRRLLIQSFLSWKGLSHVPATVHSSISWSKRDPFVLDNEEDIPWTYLKKSQSKKEPKSGNTGVVVPPTSDLATAPSITLHKRPRSSSNTKQIPQKKTKHDTEAVGSHSPTAPPCSNSAPTPAQPKSVRSFCLPTPPATQPRALPLKLPVSAKFPPVATTNDITQSSYLFHFVVPSSMVSPYSYNFNSSATSASANQNQSVFSQNKTMNSSAVPPSAFSCAYDSLYLILYQMWSEKSGTDFLVYSHLPAIIRGFQSYRQGLVTMEEARDSFQRSVQHLRPFSWGNYTSVTDLLVHIFHLRSPCFTVNCRCLNGHQYPTESTDVPPASHLGPPMDHTPISTTQWINSIPRGRAARCQICPEELRAHRYLHYNLIDTPPFMSVEVQGRNSLTFDPVMTVNRPTGAVHYILKGVVYYSQLEGHFVSRIINNNNNIYFHDGMGNLGMARFEGISSNTNFKTSKPGYVPVALLYMRF
ncbi:hypothetical protein GYMLUDRAFT_58412 [Collybiopsis luxurians FD-317 M1]|uniref:ATP-dependent DNA helicase n=1 Tax=Collybiopsis luxurians FD-317 M1 TaxID=944289 RepID=A0A0D0CHU4_9AGAR|nr:hypothetical protein GYMLUDRAFT_58412 [Collybiopsis luxurians FD-317 M1]